MEGSDATDVVFGMCGIFCDWVGVDTGQGNRGRGDRDGSSDRFLGKGERLINGFGRGDGRGGDEGDRDGGGDVV